MAKKTEKKPVQATQEALRSVRLQLPPDDHKKLRRLAADHDTNMALLVRKIVQEFIAQNWKGSVK
jgi:hypothetical protein